MNNGLICRVRQAFGTLFRLTAVFLLMSMVSIADFSTAFGDSHEAAGEKLEEKPGISGWFQLDVDSRGTYFLVGASHPLGGVSLDSNIYINDHFGEFDIGFSFPVIKNDNATLILLPMLGVGFDYTAADAPNALFPQIFVFLPAGKIYGFHWTIGTVKTIFDEEVLNELYNRTYFTYALNDTLAIGPQFESVMGFGGDDRLWALNFGARLNIGYGKHNTLGLYVGYETQKEDGETGLTGRMNFTRRW